MNTSTTRTRHFGPGVGKIAMAISLALAIGPGMAPAFADEHDNGGHDARDRSHNAAPARHDYRPQSHHAVHYAHVYAPPRVYYAPQPSPGISLFIPLG
jgi:hypothetical protein